MQIMKQKNKIRINTKEYCCEFNICNEKGIETNSTYGINKLKLNDTKTYLSPEGAQKEKVGSLCLFKSYANNAWLKTFRSDQYSYEIANNIIKLKWNPTISHQVETTAEYIFTDERFIDIKISLEAFGYYRNYEIILSNYLSKNIKNKVILKDKINGERTVSVEYNDFYTDTYPFFPRDENSINIMSDGRHKKGHWFWNCSYGKEYKYPVIISEKDNIKILLMGKRKDTHAIGTTYSGSRMKTDDVVEHYAQYIRLFGEDITPGTKLETSIRCYLLNDMEIDYKDLYNDFENENLYPHTNIELKPHNKYQIKGNSV